jgi:iron complex outermembrane receptor protein
LAGPALAQQAASGGAASTSGSPQAAPTVAEVTVTATRREQRLQDVPVAVTAISAKELDKSSFREVTDIQYLATNVTFSATNPVSNGGGYQIRGVGTQSFDSGLEQAVGLVVDGVVIGLSRDPGSTGFADVDRVEVLRGPQGTLFGKNASAGVIQVVTNKPRLGVESGDFDFAYGERNDYLARGAVNLPVSSTVAVRLSAFFDGQDGAIPNVVNGSKVGDRQNEGVRGKLLWRPNEDLSVLISAEYQRGFARDAQLIQSLGTSALYNSLFAAFPTKPGPGVYLAYNDGQWEEHTQLAASSVELNYKLGDYTLTSISAYRTVTTLQKADVDGAPINILNNSDGGVNSHEVTEEVRLTSPSGRRLEYVLGGYYYNTGNAGWVAQYGNYYGLFGVPVVVAGGRQNQKNVVDSFAVFGQGTYALTSNLKLIGGLRYTNDTNHGTLSIAPLPFPAVPISVGHPYEGTAKADNVSGKVGLEYQPNRDFMTYATATTGYNGPGLNAAAGFMTEVKPETVTSFEIGEKATLLHHTLTLNAALYWEDFYDFQTTALDSSVTPPAFIETNAGLLQSRGVEAELNWRATRGLTLSASGAYNDAVYKSYLGQCYAGQPLSSTIGTGCYTVPNTSVQVANYDGYALPNSPKWSYTLRAAYGRAIGNGLAVDANANWAWRDATQAQIGDPNARVDAYGLLGGDVGIGAENGRWRFGVYARNLLDQRFYAPYSAGVINPGGYFKIVMPDAFRTVGVKLSFKL